MSIKRKCAAALDTYRGMAVPVKASLWYTVCNFLQKGMALLATPIFARVMTEAQYGTFAVFQSWYSILIIIASLNLFMGAYEKGMILYEQTERQMTSSLLTLTTLLTCILCGIYLCAPDFWSGLLGLPPVLMGAMFLELFTMPAMEFWAARERFHYRYRRYALVSILSVLLSLSVGVAAVLCSEDKALSRIYADAIVKALFGAALFVSLMWQGRQLFDRKLWRYALAFNLPLIPHFLSTFVLNQADRIMIDNMVGSAEAAIYSMAYTVGTVVLLVSNALNQALTPYLYRSVKNSRLEDIRRNTRPLFWLMAALCILAMCFAPEIIRVFAGRKYASSIGIIPPIAASVYFIFVYSMFSTIEYYYQKTSWIAAASTVCAGLNLLLNYIFIRRYGYYAAAYTTLVCYLLFALLHYVFYRRVLHQWHPDSASPYCMKTVLLCSAAVLGVMLLMSLTYRLSWVRYLLALFMVLAAAWNRKRLGALLRLFRRGNAA